MNSVRLGLLLAAVFAYGCSNEAESAGGTTADAGPDARLDAGDGTTGDASPETGADAVKESGVRGCAAGSRPGASGATDGMMTPAGHGYNVRTPSSYDPLRAYPLTVAFAPSGGTAESIEQATQLTSTASAAGHLIAYVDTVSPTDVAGAQDVALVGQLVADAWCVDPKRIYYTGSSDGGGVIYTMVLNDYSPLPPAAIAPFAAGTSPSALSGLDCLAAPFSVMVMHNSGDMVFPVAYGQAGRDYWARCNECGPAAAPLANGCVPFTGCKDGVEVQYCEGSGGHGAWPPLNADIFAFFDRFSR